MITKLGVCAAALLTSAVFAAAQPATDGKPGTASPIDAVLAQAETDISALESLSHDSACPPTLTDETLLRDVLSDKAAPGFGGPSAGLDLRLYSFCGAYTQGKPALCDGLDKLNGQYTYDGSGNLSGGMRAGSHSVHDWASRCRTSLEKTGFAKAEISGAPDLPAVCRGFFASRMYVRKPEIEKACAVFTGGISDVGAACAQLIPLFEDAITPAYCAVNIGTIIGDPAACTDVKEEYPRIACLGHAAYAKSVRTKDPAACADSPFCRMMQSGKPESCGVFLDDVRKSACKDRYLPEYVVERGRTISPQLDIAISQLKAKADPTMADDDRTEKALRLKMRYGALETAASAALTVRTVAAPAPQ